MIREYEHQPLRTPARNASIATTSKANAMQAAMK
jgi:hypothetical protein